MSRKQEIIIQVINYLNIKPLPLYIQGYYKRNRYFQRYVVSKPLA